jgi:hypothetical protein
MTSTSLPPNADVRSAKISCTSHSAVVLEALELLGEDALPESPGLGDADCDDILDADREGESALKLTCHWQLQPAHAMVPIAYVPSTQR